MTTDPESVGIIGLGLIGGSVARDLVARQVTVTAYDRDVERLRALGDADLRGITLTSSPRDAANADVLMIAVPVTEALDVLKTVAPHVTRARLIMDVGSTKRSIVSLAESLGIGARFVGGHPMAGDHHFAWSASRRDLFVGAPVYLCPAATTAPDAIAHARRFWEMLGASTTTMDAAEHDERLAWTSHLPHAVAAALAQSLNSAGVSRAELGPGGRDMTRVAGSSPDMWAQIWMDNAAHMAESLDAMEGRLRELRDRIQRGNVEAVREWFEDGRRWFERSERLRERP